ncbi:MAG: sugar phosphate isomerase/epimerase [Thermomicrobiales bacterium]|nr:sugar phosphate isomerase/epimerase [Thermomicrobiales bacterium]
MSHPDNPIAIQLYTVRGPAAQDFAGTLRRLADGGARAVEFAGYGGLEIPALRDLLQELGLRVCGSHIRVEQWEEHLKQSLADLKTLGGEYAVVPWVPEERRGSLEAARTLAASLDVWGTAARDAGLGFAYHHHAFEFNPLPDGNGATLFDILVQESDPALVGFEVDVYWAARGGVDPARLLRQLRGRAPLMHLKDLGPAPDHVDVPAGAGELDWTEIRAAARDAGVRWEIVEQDTPNPDDPVADALLAMRNMTA